MLQIFYKTSKISYEDWDKAYKRIEFIVNHFPLRLIRVEAYNGYSPNLDKDHFDLKENTNTQDESLSFYGDWDSYTTGTTIRFYKNWDKYVISELSGSEIDSNKSITWFPHYPFRNDGSLCQANGQSTKHGYIDTRNAAYAYAIVAIAIMMENLLPGKVFFIGSELPVENIEDVVNWLEIEFNEQFELPIYYDKLRLLDSFKQEYNEDSHVVCRVAHLFRNQHKHNIKFAIENIGYKPTLDCYGDILSDNAFGTFGFSDVLDSWIAVTQNLDSALEIITVSKEINTEKEKAHLVKQYDSIIVLKKFLNNFILWTTIQREELEVFYTNKQSLETGNESLMGMIYRMTGNRLDICPMYATKQELFEAFMYHEPQKGEVFKNIIDEWLEKNTNTFDDLKFKLSEHFDHQERSDEQNNDKEDSKQSNDFEYLLKQYSNHERPFIELSVRNNPALLNIEQGTQELIEKIEKIITSTEHQDHLKTIILATKEENIKFIKKRIKRDIQCSVHPHFELWLEEEDNKTVLFYLGSAEKVKPPIISLLCGLPIQFQVQYLKLGNRLTPQPI